MKITRFAQSCILIQTNDKRILIDPWYIQYKESYPDNEWQDIDILLVTHKHGDHCHVAAIKKIIENSKAFFYTTKEVADTYPELSPKIIKAWDILSIDNIHIEAVKAVHGYIPPLKSGKQVYENVWYIIDDGNTRAYHTSDTICFENEYHCDVIFVPVCNHGLVMSPFEAALFSKETAAKLAIACHYENPSYPADLKQVKENFEKYDMPYRFLEIWESIEI